MPRRQFIKDLQKTQSEALPLGVHDVEQGEDDGQFTFTFSGTPAAPFLEAVKITALVPDLDEYPKNHTYMLFSSDDAPQYIGAALNDVRGMSRKSVFELIDIVSARLARVTPDKDGDTEMPDSQTLDEDQLEDEDEDDIYDSDHEAFGGMGDPVPPTRQGPTTAGKVSAAGGAFRRRIRSDLRAAKQSGFKVGQLGLLLDGLNCYLTISIRASKLGISGAAMQAWQIRPNEYLILIIQYPNGYKTAEELQDLDSLRLAPNIGFRVCASKRYKPTLQEAIKAFTVIQKTEGRDSLAASTNSIPAPEAEPEEGGLRETFISKPLNGLLQERLVQILRYRGVGMGWQGAEEWFLEVASNGPSGADQVPDACFEPEPPNEALPPIVNDDHYLARAGKHGLERSFPLLAMQFLLRHFVRCTDFCLVCHRKLTTEVEAIKPYVCDQPLCLYQYMTLGFGPSIEHEILAQPYVVDLLISFCYASATGGKLKDYPDGLALMIPPINPAGSAAAAHGYYSQPNTAPLQQGQNSASADCNVYDVGFDKDRLELIFFEKPAQCPVRRGSWILLRTQSGLEGLEMHCRVADVNYYPTITLDPPIALAPLASVPDNVLAKASSTGTPKKAITPAPTPNWATASFQIYQQDFEELSKSEKCLAICKLLDTLPTVKAMQEYLAKKRPSDLKSWVERISPAALSLLRWIIASNRACIMQVDGDGASQTQDRMSGMNGYMQFRFAMGAPDKEQRFMTEVRKTTTRLTLAHPTIFAWHGSPLPNWHMIIREGLHYQNTDHGRAYGHGVYHAKDAMTSLGYAGRQYYPIDGNRAGQGAWPQSVLRISSALALNEIVNAPEEFVSCNPFYVVQHLDWIQTRYLFVQCVPLDERLKGCLDRESSPTSAHPQDPKRTPSGISNKKIVIPASAIKSGRGTGEDSSSGGRKLTKVSKWQSPFKRLKGSGGFSDPIAIEDDGSASDTTDTEDVELLIEEPEILVDEPRNDSSATSVMKPLEANDTDFIPGTLDYKTLPLMPTPTYAISNTTKRLLKELQNLQTVQQTTPTSSLGWSLDIPKTENVYQWLVQLHSFHLLNPTLPLVTDMRKTKLHSIVLEIRFNKDFPYTPPYIRVVRPRFQTFAQGGGGHIVAGGAMCMELLTNSGWSSVSSMESVLMQVRLAIASEPFARLDLRSKGDYGTGEAAEGYMRACRAHGWVVPEGFAEMAYGMGKGA
ncbi:hypothetical protein B0A50_00291 [Salinomyces thailandicus]|uniref:UBC core domain-containing protein n=1 Tax=Salinomyces thailandicus TaxID=706561 RepID=A0A4U0UFH3_9PEZI|nr:hypothetical protein B0A50_00291 [Salinomyces thailandica]